MNLLAILAVFVGAGCGALLRWGFGLWLNPIVPTLPLGTVAANLVGGLLIGLAGGLFAANAALPPELRLLVITGFLGGLTTFSTFSAEVVDLIARHEYAWAAGAASLHLFGSLLLTGVGLWLAQALQARAAGGG